MKDDRSGRTSPESTVSREALLSDNQLVLSYLAVRRAIGFSGLMLPVVLGPVGWVMGVGIQDNMSSYYHTPLRDVFVGTLCAMAVFLFCYRGYGWIENWSANLGGLSALGVALFPIDAAADPLHQRSPIGQLHSLSGGVFFCVLAFYSLYHFPRFGRFDRRRADDPDHGRFERNTLYVTSGLTILASMIAMGAYLLVLPPKTKVWLDDYNALFWLEWVAVWSFAVAWLAKGRTIVTEIALDLATRSRKAVVAIVTGGNEATDHSNSNPDD